MFVSLAPRIGFIKNVISDLKSGSELLLGFLTTVLFSYFPISLESKVAWQLTICFLALFVVAKRRVRSELIR
jgi:hypothetical protein